MKLFKTWLQTEKGEVFNKRYVDIQDLGFSAACNWEGLSPLQQEQIIKDYILSNLDWRFVEIVP